MSSPKPLFAALLLTLPLLAGQQSCEEPESCFFNEPASFSSVAEGECGLGPDGPVYCHWSLRFDQGEFNWHHSDYVEFGTYSCEGDTVKGSTSYADYSGTWDAVTGVLMWEGVAYR